MKRTVPQCLLLSLQKLPMLILTGITVILLDTKSHCNLHSTDCLPGICNLFVLLSYYEIIVMWSCLRKTM